MTLNPVRTKEDCRTKGKRTGLLSQHWYVKTPVFLDGDIQMHLLTRRLLRCRKGISISDGKTVTGVPHLRGNNLGVGV